MNIKPTLNTIVFVKDENDPALRSYTIRRAQEAVDPKNRSKNISVTESKAHLPNVAESSHLMAKYNVRVAQAH